jgi:putative Ca2+/H+ antiporter (TMEM165/GDT1 family)
MLALLPERPVELVAAALFAVGAFILFRGARRADEEEAGTERAYEHRITDARTGLRAFGASFLVLFAAEWGDLSQLLTAGLVATGRPALAVFAGSWAALAAVSGAAVLLGRVLLRRVRLSIVRYVSATICAALALITAVAAVA